MHELGILRHVAQTVNHIAEKEHIKQIKHITLEIGNASGVVPYYLKKVPNSKESLQISSENRITYYYC